MNQRGRDDGTAQCGLLEAALREINVARRSLGVERTDHLRRAGALLEADATCEMQFCEEMFEPLLGQPANRLAVYGSLAPGERNDWVLRELAGEWKPGLVRGVLHPDGWGASQGFPGMQWVPTAGIMSVLLFSSPELPQHWTRIDAFEGDDYRRILIPVGLDGGDRVVANIYEVRREP